MNRLRQTMSRLRDEQRTALVIYITCGDPSADATVDIVEAAANAGADVIELGVPFSDPNADGVVIQQAMQRALAAGGGLTPTLDVVRRLRARGCDVPVVLFGYYNPIFVHGVDRFAAAAAEAGADAVLTVDVPLDELDELRTPLAAHGLDVVPLIAPTSGPDRMRRARDLEAPFIYYISMTGITGAALTTPGDDLASRAAQVREATATPVAIGFGIKTPDDAARVARHADGVVVGSAVVQAIEAAGPTAAPAAVATLVQSLRTAIDR